MEGGTLRLDTLGDGAGGCRPVLEATGAILFTTLELRRPVTIAGAGVWRWAEGTTAPPSRQGHGSVVGRTARWLLGR